MLAQTLLRPRAPLPPQRGERVDGEAFARASREHWTKIAHKWLAGMLPTARVADASPSPIRDPFTLPFSLSLSHHVKGTFPWAHNAPFVEGWCDVSAAVMVDPLTRGCVYMHIPSKGGRNPPLRPAISPALVYNRRRLHRRGLWSLR
eukprot:716104-Prorocentrum_minimum.AAC.1